jgi:DNA invertase Pin-like site-specific DNA recombinase
MTKPRNAALLVRISEDRGGEAAGVGRQEADARAMAARLGWTVGEVFTENDTSAYKRRKVTLPDGTTALRELRPEFRRLLDLIGSGQVDGLIAYHLDRVARDPRDLEDLIDVVERTGIPVESVTGSLRLASDADITMARIGVAIANQSSRDSSRRIRRKHQELAEQGRYAGGGARRYGYERDGVTVRETEAETIRWCAARVLEGATVASLVRELDRQGVRPVKAAKWSTKTLHDILRSPRVAGLRVHRGEVAGPAEWPAILDRETWEAVVATLHARGRGTAKPSLRRWLNGVLFCGLCGHPLSASYTSPKARQVYRYWCNTHRDDGCGRIAISGPGVEEEVTRQVLEYLARPDVLQALSGATSEQSSSAARREIAEDEQQLRDLSRMWAEKVITLDEYATARKIIEGRIEAARAVLAAHIPARLREVLSADDAGAAWENLAPVDKRELVRLLLASGGYRGWVVDPADRTKPRRFDPERLRLDATRPEMS